MVVTREIEAALVVVAGIWAAELKDVDLDDREIAVSKWIDRMEYIYQHLRKDLDEKVLIESKRSGIR